MNITIRQGRRCALHIAAAAVFVSVGPAAPAQAQLPDEESGPDGYVMIEHSSSRAREVSKAECMAAAGFTYIPWVYESETWAPAGADGHPLPASGEHPYLVRLSSGVLDKNAEIVGSLTVSERIDYYHALYGERATLDDQGHLTFSLDVIDGACA